MSEDAPWLTRLRELVSRRGANNDPTEQLSLSVVELFATVADYEICEAYHLRSKTGEPVANPLAAECGRRNLDF